MTLPVALEGVELFRRDVPLRLPFRFGAVTLRALCSVMARVRAATPRGTEVGTAAEFAVPGWFRKDPKRRAGDDVSDLIASARAAAASWARHAASQRPAFLAWWDVYRERVESLPAGDPERLVRGFGVALVERAVLDATCRAAGVAFHTALREDLFGVEPGRVRPALRGFDLPRSLAAQPLDRVVVRHTVGMLDPLDDASVPRVGDGLPETVGEVVAAHGVRCFKIKVGQGVDADAARLVAVAQALRGHVERPVVTLDGNEQYPDVATVLAMLDAARRHRDGAWLLDGLEYIEQPLRRDRTFDAGPNAALRDAPVPFVIDEADSGIDAFQRAVRLGYRGVSAKSCKGVFRALLNRGVAQLVGGFQTGEDLTTVPVWALQQDLALIASLGLPHAERNGHHFVGRLDHLSAREVAGALRAHPDLYAPDGDGARVRVADGCMAVRSLAVAGFGHGVELDASETDATHRIPLP